MLTAAILLVACNSAGDTIGISKGSGSVTVKVMYPSPSKQSYGVGYVGTIEAQSTAVVSSPAAGTLTRLAVRCGQQVTKGQELAQISSPSVSSAYDMARSKLIQAEDGYARLSKVAAAGSVPEVKMVEMETALAQAQAAMSAAQSALDKCMVKAPMNGIVEKIFVEEGFETAPAEMILRLVDASTLEIRFPVPESEIGKIAVGDTATVEIPALGMQVQCTVCRKGVVASSFSHTYDCMLTVPKVLNGLLPGMVCKVHIDAPTKSPRTIIPASCVRTDNEGRYVWTVTDGLVEKYHITVEGYSGGGVVVTNGLPEGAAIIIEGSRKVSSGMKVEVLE